MSEIKVTISSEAKSPSTVKWYYQRGKHCTGCFSWNCTFSEQQGTGFYLLALPCHSIIFVFNQKSKTFLKN